MRRFSVLVAVLLAGGCGDDDPGAAVEASPVSTPAGEGEDLCSLMFERLSTCEPKILAHVKSEQEYVETCRSQRQKRIDAGTYDAEGAAAAMRCTQIQDCAEFRECTRGAIKTESNNRRVRRIESGDIAKRAKRCRNVGPTSPAEVVEACTNNAPELVAGMHEVIRESIRTGERTRYDCRTLTLIAERVSESEVDRAKVLCRAGRGADDARATIAKAKEHLAANEPKIPVGCHTAANGLDDVDEPWAPRLRQDVIDVCVRDLGVLIMKTFVPTMGDTCHREAKRIMNMAARYEVDDPELNRWFERIEPVCGRLPSRR